jgi:hypothetical protein
MGIDTNVLLYCTERNRCFVPPLCVEPVCEHPVLAS